MRIVGGRFKRASLVSPKGMDTRPTTDRVRETLFNVLQNHVDLEGSRIVDFFAGTGALGFEALSRGAEFCLFVEQASAACKSIEQNINNLGIQQCCCLIKRDALKLKGNPEDLPFDIAFADPPYNRGYGERLAQIVCQENWLKPNALLVLEEEVSAMPDALDGFTCLDKRVFGNSALGLFQLGEN